MADEDVPRKRKPAHWAGVETADVTADKVYLAKGWTAEIPWQGEGRTHIVGYSLLPRSCEFPMQTNI